MPGSSVNDSKSKRKVSKQEKKKDNGKISPKQKNLIVTTPQDVRSGLNDAVLETGRPFLLLVHAPWCHFCKQLRPDWERLVDWLSDTDVQCVEMEMSMLPEERDKGDGSLIRVIEGARAKSIEGVPFIALVLPANVGVALYDQFVRASVVPERVLVGGEAERPRSALHMLRFVEAGVKYWRTKEGEAAEARKQHPRNRR